MKPHLNNFCGGNFSDWLEVLLLSNCNGKCEWCIEKSGYHPDSRASVDKIADQILKSGKQNVILLGGEPLIYAKMKKLVKLISSKSVYITTNGSKLNYEYIKKNLKGIAGVNISIHDFDLSKNFDIVKLGIDESALDESIKLLKSMGIKIRFNCNLINGHIVRRRF